MVPIQRDQYMHHPTLIADHLNSPTWSSVQFDASTDLVDAKTHFSVPLAAGRNGQHAASEVYIHISSHGRWESCRNHQPLIGQHAALEAFLHVSACLGVRRRVDVRVVDHDDAPIRPWPRVPPISFEDASLTTIRVPNSLDQRCIPERLAPNHCLKSRHGHLTLAVVGRVPREQVADVPAKCGVTCHWPNAFRLGNPTLAVHPHPNYALPPPKLHAAAVAGVITGGSPIPAREFWGHPLHTHAVKRSLARKPPMPAHRPGLRLAQ